MAAGTGETSHDRKFSFGMSRARGDDSNGQRIDTDRELLQHKWKIAVVNSLGDLVRRRKWVQVFHLSLAMRLRLSQWLPLCAPAGIGDVENDEDMRDLEASMSKLLPCLTWCDVRLGNQAKDDGDPSAHAYAIALDIAIYLYNAFADCRWFAPAIALARVSHELGCPLETLVEVPPDMLFDVASSPAASKHSSVADEPPKLSTPPLSKSAMPGSNRSFKDKGQTFRDRSQSREGTRDEFEIQNQLSFRSRNTPNNVFDPTNATQSERTDKLLHPR